MKTIIVLTRNFLRHSMDHVWTSSKSLMSERITAWKVPKYRVFSGPYFSYEYRKIRTRKKLCIWTYFTPCFCSVFRFGAKFHRRTLAIHAENLLMIETILNLIFVQLNCNCLNYVDSRYMKYSNNTCYSNAVFTLDSAILTAKALDELIYINSTIA